MRIKILLFSFVLANCFTVVTAATLEVFGNVQDTGTFNAVGPNDPTAPANPFASFSLDLASVEPQFDPALGTLISTDTRIELVTIANVVATFNAIPPIFAGSQKAAIQMTISTVTDIPGNLGPSPFLSTSNFISQLTSCGTGTDPVFTCGDTDNIEQGVAIFGSSPIPASAQVDMNFDEFVVNAFGGLSEFDSLDVSVQAIVSIVKIFEFLPAGHPIAEAGPNQSIHAGQLVQLDGSGSSDDITATQDLLYDWSFTQKPAGSTTALSGAATISPSFVADLPGTYRISLVVTDEDANVSSPDVVTVSSLNLPPNADAGTDQGAIVGDNVVLDGSGSADPDFDPISFAWTLISQPAGSVAILSGADTVSPSFIPDVAGTYEAQLIVNDGFANSSPDTVLISVITAEAAAETLLIDALNVVGSLPDSSFDKAGNRSALQRLISRAISHLQAGRVTQAVATMEEAVERTDGCALRGTPDTARGMGAPQIDLINNCPDQALVYPSLAEAVALLQ